jgi:hypothetical protein
MAKDYLEDVSEAARKVAPEIEKLLQGLSVSDAKEAFISLDKEDWGGY